MLYSVLYYSASLYKLEVQYMEGCAPHLQRGKGLARMVPKLQETHIVRDSRTKLNVSPAKIMQVCVCECGKMCLMSVTVQFRQYFLNMESCSN